MSRTLRRPEAVGGGLWDRSAKSRNLRGAGSTYVELSGRRSGTDLHSQDAGRTWVSTHEGSRMRSTWFPAVVAMYSSVFVLGACNKGGDVSEAPLEICEPGTVY